MKVSSLSLSCLLVIVVSWQAQASPIPTTIAGLKDLFFVPSNVNAPKAILIPEKNDNEVLAKVPNNVVLVNHNKAAVVSNAKAIALAKANAEALAKAKALAIANAAQQAKVILAQQGQVNLGRPITVLPLGDSITFGLGAIDLNSYRNQLQERLGLDAVEIDFVGSVRSGVMQDNENEGRSGATIDEIGLFAERVLGLKPQVVTLIAGTNDVAQNLELANAPLRLLNLITKIQQASPASTILVGSIPPLAIGNNARQAQVDAFNEAIALLINARERAGQRVSFVDLSDVGIADLADGIHPNAIGYVKIGDAFARAFESALERGLISASA